MIRLRNKLPYRHNIQLFSLCRACHLERDLFLLPASHPYCDYISWWFLLLVSSKSCKIIVYYNLKVYIACYFYNFRGPGDSMGHKPNLEQFNGWLINTHKSQLRFHGWLMNLHKSQLRFRGWLINLHKSQLRFHGWLMNLHKSQLRFHEWLMNPHKSQLRLIIIWPLLEAPPTLRGHSHACTEF